MPVNNNRSFLSTRRLINDLPKKIIEKVIEETRPEVVVAETLKVVDEGVISFFDLNHRELLDINNIHIISKTRQEQKDSEQITTTSEFIKSLDGKTFDSYDDLLQAIENYENIQIIFLSMGSLATYKVGNETDGWATVKVSISDENKRQINNDYTPSNYYIFPANDIYSVSDLKNIYKLSENQISLFFDKNGEEYTIKNNLTWNGEKITDFSQLFMKLDKEYKAITATLKEQGFSDDFVTYLLQYVKENAQIDEQNGESFDVSTIIEKYKDSVSNLTSDTNLYYKNTTQQMMRPDRKTNVFDYDISSKTILSLLNDMKSSSSNSQVKLFASMFLDTFDKLDLNDRGKEIFMQRIFKNISEKLGQNNANLLTFNNLSQLNENNNSWLDELYEIISEEASKVKIVDRNPSTIDVDALFGDKDVLTAEDIFNGCEDENNILSDDGGVREFYNQINNAFLSHNPIIKIDNYYDRNELFNSLISLINKKFGIENTNPPVLTKEVINKLNQNSNFNIINTIINSDELKKEYYVGSINGEIGNYGQGNTGDCWLLSGINSLNASTIGQQILKNAIKINNDGTYTVTFNGIGTAYTFTYDDIVNALEHSYGAYSNGDRDALLIELAMEKLANDIKDGNIIVPKEILDKGLPNIMNRNENNIIDGGKPEFLSYVLTGYSGCMLYTSDLYMLYSIVGNDFQSGRIGITCGYDMGGDYETIEIDGFIIVRDHAYTIVDVTVDENDPTNNTVTIVNPWHSEEKLTLNWSEFSKYFNRIDMMTFEKPSFSNNDIINSVVESIVQGNNSISKLSYIFAEEPNLGIENIKTNYDSWKGDIITFDYNNQHYEIRENRYASDTILSVEDLDKFFEASSLTPEQKQKIIDFCFLPRCVIDDNTTHYQMKSGITLDNLEQMIELAQTNEVKDNIDIIETKGVAELLKICAKGHTGMLTGINILVMSDKVNNIEYSNIDGIEQLSFDYEGVNYSINFNPKESLNFDVIMTYDELMSYFNDMDISEYDAYKIINEYFTNIGSRSDDDKISVSSSYSVFKGFIFALKDDKSLEDFLNVLKNL